MRSIHHLLNMTMTIQRPGSTQQGAGFVEQLTTIATKVPCRRAPMSTTDQDFAASVQAVVNQSVWCQPDTDIKRDDVLTIDAATINGVLVPAATYEVREILMPSIPVYKKALSEEIQTGL